MEQKHPDPAWIWNQKDIPVLFRRSAPNPLQLRMPYGTNNYEWLREGKRRKPDWNPSLKCWELPISWFEGLIARLLERHGLLYVIQVYKEQQKCAPACWNAKGFHCECSCMGANHGTGHPGASWYEVSDTFAFSRGKAKYSCRLLVAK